MFPEMVTSPSISVTLMICVWSVESLVCWTILLDTLAIASVVAEVIFFETADPMFFILCGFVPISSAVSITERRPRFKKREKRKAINHPEYR